MSNEQQHEEHDDERALWRADVNRSFDELLVDIITQREAVECLETMRPLPPAYVEAALAWLDDQRAAIAHPTFTTDERAQLVAEFERCERTLRSRLEN